MANEEGRRCLAIVGLKSDSNMPRIAKDVPQIIALFSRLSSGEHEQAFRSNDGLLFGYLFKSAKPGPVMRAEFEACPGTQNGDSLVVLEIEGVATGLGFSRAWTWLQHH